MRRPRSWGRRVRGIGLLFRCSGGERGLVVRRERGRGFGGERDDGVCGGCFLSLLDVVVRRMIWVTIQVYQKTRHVIRRDDGICGNMGSVRIISERL